MDWKYKRLLGFFLVIVFVACIVGIGIIAFKPIETISNPPLFIILLSIGQFLALTGFFFISILIFTGDFARLFDGIFGIDKIIKTQRKFAILTYFIVFSHPIFMILAQNSHLKFLVPGLASLPGTFGGLAVYLFAGIMISSLSYKKISYKAWQYIHILTYVLFGFIWFHAFNLGLSVNTFPVNVIFYGMPFVIFAGLIYRFSYKFKQRKNKFVVEKVERENHSAFKLVLKPNRKINFKPGQFFFLRIDGKKLHARHPFSVSNVSSDGNLVFAVKDSGRFTKAASELNEGDEVKVEGPFGNFVVDSSDFKDLVLIAGGVGIAPFMGMIKANSKLDSKEKKKILLLYSCKKESDIIFKKELDSIEGDWFEKVYFLSSEKKEGYVHGRINKEILAEKVGDFSEKKFYICGPDAMNRKMISILKELGVKRRNIYFEDFFW